MMIVSSSLLLVNRLRAVQSDAAGGRSARFRSVVGRSERIGGRRSRDLKAPATSVSSEIELLKCCASTIALQAATGIEVASALKYTSSGVRYS
jgi:hypothetical protein